MGSTKRWRFAPIPGDFGGFGGSIDRFAEAASQGTGGFGGEHADLSEREHVGAVGGFAAPDARSRISVSVDQPLVEEHYDRSG